MVGRFILGMVSGGLVVTGGLVIGSVLFPTRPANDDAVAPVEDPIAAPAAAEADAGAAPEADESAEPVAEAVIAEPEPEATVTASEPAEPAPAPPLETVASSPEPAAVPEPEVTAAATAPAAPEPPAAETPVEAPAVAEVASPETVAEPSKPAATEADAAAEAPDALPEPVTTEAAGTAAPASEPATEPTVETASDPAPVAAEPAPSVAVAEAEAEPLPEPAPATDAVTTEDAAPAPAPVAENSEVAPPAPAEAAPADTMIAEATPAPDLPAPEVLPDPALPEAPAEERAVEVPAPEAEAAPVPAPATEDAAVAEDAPVDTMPGTRPAALPGTDQPETAAKSSTFTPAPSLPRAGTAEIIEGDKAAAEAPATDPAAAAPDPRPIARFAATFENPDAKPALAILLIDDGSATLDRAALASLPFPVSFALDPLDPASAAHAAIYRAAGKEVVMLVTGIAEGAMPADVEVAFQSMEQGLPEAVAVMDLAEPSFQNRRPLAATVVPILKAQGRGLLTWDEGLNAADQVARREDLEAAVIFRDLGSAGGDAAAVRRLMDRAVFKAGQEGRAVVVGTADPATVAALLEWTVEGKAATVALAPVTGVLKID